VGIRGIVAALLFLQVLEIEVPIDLALPVGVPGPAASDLEEGIARSDLPLVASQQDGCDRHARSGFRLASRVVVLLPQPLDVHARLGEAPVSGIGSEHPTTGGEPGRVVVVGEKVMAGRRELLV